MSPGISRISNDIGELAPPEDGRSMEGRGGLEEDRRTTLWKNKRRRRKRRRYEEDEGITGG